MKCFPAIDIRQGQAVRLYQGDYDQMTVYHHSPLEVAKEFASKGATHLHLVDLDGAKNGELVNLEVIGQILEAVPLFLQVGGGIRDMERIKAYLDNGVHRVILGTAAVEDFFAGRGVRLRKLPFSHESRSTWSRSDLPARTRGRGRALGVRTAAARTRRGCL